MTNQNLELENIIVEELAGHIRISYSDNSGNEILLSSDEAKKIGKFLNKFDYTQVEACEKERYK